MKIECTKDFIYINDALTFVNRKLLSECRKLKKDDKIKYVWTRNNRVMIRVKDGEKIIYVNALSDLKNLESTLLNN